MWSPVSASSPSSSDSREARQKLSADWILTQLSDPIKIGLVLFIIWLLWKIIRFSTRNYGTSPEPEPSLPPLKKQDFTVEQLKVYDGSWEDGRILIAVNRKVYDVTSGKRHYGKDAPYGGLAGRDASRALAKFQVDCVSDKYDDLSDLDQGDMDQIREWDTQFSEKYVYIGKLLKPGEEPTSYSDEDDDEEEEVQKPSTSKKFD